MRKKGRTPPGAVTPAVLAFGDKSPPSIPETSEPDIVVPVAGPISDTGFQAFKGENNELVMEEKPERGPNGDPTGLHMQNFLAAVKSRNYKDLHDEIGIA